MRSAAIFLLIFAVAFASPHYNYDSFPNPQKFDGYRNCHLRQRGHLCDPEEVLSSDSEREQLAELLDTFQNQTQNPLGNTPCKRKGISVGIALTKQHIAMKDYKIVREEFLKKETYEAISAWRESQETYITGLLIGKKLADSWAMDEDCQKVVMILYPVDEPLENITLFSYKTVPLLNEDKDHLLAVESHLIKARKHFEALRNLLEGLRQIIIHRQAMFFSSPPAIVADPPSSPSSSVSAPLIILISTLISACLIFALPRAQLVTEQFLAQRRRFGVGHNARGMEIPPMISLNREPEAPLV